MRPVEYLRDRETGPFAARHFRDCFWPGFGTAWAVYSSRSGYPFSHYHGTQGQAEDEARANGFKPLDPASVEYQHATDPSPKRCPARCTDGKGRSLAGWRFDQIESDGRLVASKCEECGGKGYV